MNNYKMKLKLLKKYYKKIATSYDFYIGKDNVSNKHYNNVKNKFAPGLKRDEIIGFYDVTVFGSGKNGYVFTDTKIIYNEVCEKPKKIWYEDIKKVELFSTHKKDCDRGIRVHLHDGGEVCLTSCSLNKTPLYEFLVEIIKLENKQKKAQMSSSTIEYKTENCTGAMAGGIAASSYGAVNKSFEEEKFHARQGHGFAAEKANNLYDNATGHKAKIVGDNNAVNGADRIVDGICIQSKYCATGSRCINECFSENGKGAFRYYNDGKPMQIEVPSDKYDAAIQAMEEKIRRGQVNGVSDPEEAKNIVRKGHFTYAQAKNIAKAGTLESLSYDAINGTIIATSAFGVTAAITLGTSIWNGEDIDVALQKSVSAGLKVGGTSFLVVVLEGQLSKAGLNSMLVGSSEAIVKIMGPKASAVLVNAFRNGSNIYGAAAMKSAAKLLRGNVITGGITIVVLSAFDIANIFRGRISGKQLFKNITNTGATVAGGAGGWVAGAAIGSAIVPGVGTIIGGLVGSIAAGATAGKIVDGTMGVFIEDDAEEIVKNFEIVFQEIAEEYLLNQKEAEKAVDKLKDKLDGDLLKDMFASDSRRTFARNILIPIVEDEVSKRAKVTAISNNQMTSALKVVLEEIYDAQVRAV